MTSMASNGNDWVSHSIWDVILSDK